MKFFILAFTLMTSAFAAEDMSQKVHSTELFMKAAKVIQSPRCLNCHPNGDRPTQGDDLHAHTMNVKRGANNTGAVAMQCFACHQTQNNETSGIPGAEGWFLAPKEMTWQGKTTREICVQIKDKKRNGGRSLDELVEHMKAPLVAWAWNPGGNRNPAPGTHEDFVKTVDEWVKTGAHCPEK